MGSKTPKITYTIEKNMAMELIYAAYSAATRKQQGILPHYDRCTEHHKRWLTGIDETISPFELHDLELVFSTLATRIMLFYMNMTYGLNTGEDLIRKLHETDDGQFIDNFRRVILIDKVEDDWIRKERLIQAFEEDWMGFGMDFNDEADALVALLKTPSYFRSRLVEVLTWFNERYILPYEEKILSMMDEHISAYEGMMVNQPELTLERLTNGNPELVLERSPEIRIYPVVMNTHDISIYMPDIIYMVYGVDHARKLLDSSVEERTDELIKAISDPKRMQIMRLLKERQWYSREIATELGLTPATVSYHVDLLFQAGLIKVDKPKGRRFYYNLNEKGMEELIGCLKEEFLK